MKFIQQPRYGPLHRFTDYHVYKSLSILSDGERKGRKLLADRIGVGEGSMRTIVEYLRKQGLIEIKQTGIRITRKGQELISRVPLQTYSLESQSMTLGDASVAVQVKNVGHKVGSGLEQRDRALLAGAKGATTVVVRKGELIIPVDYNLDTELPDAAAEIRRLFDLEENDVIIIGTSVDLQKAEEGALSAAFELI